MLLTLTHLIGSNPYIASLDRRSRQSKWTNASGNAKNLLFTFVFIWNWKGYRALRQNSGRHWRRNARCSHAIDRIGARSQSVSREISHVGLWAQPINGGGDDRGLCTTPLEYSGLEYPASNTPPSGIGSLAMFAEDRVAMTSRARETWKKKEERKKKESSRL